MTPKSKVSRLNLNSCACTGQALTRVGRYLVILSALSLLTMPLTEYLWTWDRFLQTGRDFEIGTLMGLSVFCLVLVLSKQCKQCVESFMSRWSVLAFQFIDRVTPEICLPAELQVFYPEPVAGPGTGMCHFPLQI